jgi:hypothetical protein
VELPDSGKELFSMRAYEIERRRFAGLLRQHDLETPGMDICAYVDPRLVRNAAAIDCPTANHIRVVTKERPVDGKTSSFAAFRKDPFVVNAAA